MNELELESDALDREIKKLEIEKARLEKQRAFYREHIQLVVGREMNDEEIRAYGKESEEIVAKMPEKFSKQWGVPEEVVRSFIEQMEKVIAEELERECPK
jgi:hypothetical protein